MYTRLFDLFTCLEVCKQFGGGPPKKPCYVYNGKAVKNQGFL